MIEERERCVCVEHRIHTMDRLTRSLVVSVKVCKATLSCGSSDLWAQKNECVCV